MLLSTHTQAPGEALQAARLGALVADVELHGEEHNDEDEGGGEEEEAILLLLLWLLLLLRLPPRGRRG